MIADLASAYDIPVAVFSKVGFDFTVLKLQKVEQKGINRCYASIIILVVVKVFYLEMVYEVFLGA